MSDTIEVSRIAVTTSFSPDDEVVLRAHRIEQAVGCPFLNREEFSLDEVRDLAERDCLIVCTSTQVRLVTSERVFWWHPNMAPSRIESLRRGEGDRLTSYMDLGPGDRVLDLTCGLGADAIVSAHIVGDRGQVHTVEKSLILAAMAREGMDTFKHRTQDVVDAVRRVRVVEGDAADYLAEQSDASWDVVHVDPMFEGTLDESQGLEVVRKLAQVERVSQTLVDEARRVARRCVVMKDRVPGKQLNRLGFEDWSMKGKIYYGKQTGLGRSVALEP